MTYDLQVISMELAGCAAPQWNKPLDNTTLILIIVGAILGLLLLLLACCCVSINLSYSYTRIENKIKGLFNASGRSNFMTHLCGRLGPENQ